ncbi:unnamed protein product [Urochloa decumbens]|uniref:Disease resistance protein At4g27190-like leucine-rich repeats domain-containing protein n=1 Tax=Urochloa decumbens TaxID=240449 RepID=A0ABC8ZLJ2_9POAL
MTSEHLETQTIQTIPEEATSYFLTLQNSDLPNNLFPQSSQLRVLKLSSCAFSFTSPPFHWCDNMRFLCIDSCKDNGRSTDELIVKQGESWRFLRRLWVLDIRHTDGSWILIPQMMELMTELRELNIKAVGVSSWNWHMYLAKQKFLHNLHKFRIIECPIQFMDLLRIPLIGMYRLEFLDLSGNKHMEVLPNLSTASGLKVLILDGCDGLRNVESHALPSSLESFSFDGFGPALKWKHLLEIPRKEARPSVRITQKTPIVSKISLNGLALLKNLFLRGLPNLLELNLSETAVQAVNLDDMQLRNLERLSLLGCEMLQRVQWHDTRNPPLKVLQIDTRAKATRSLDHDCQGFQMDNNSSPQAHIVVTDERVLRGFMITHPISNVLQGQKFHLHLSSSVSNKQGSYYNQKESSSSDELSAPQVIESPFSYLGLLSNIAGHDDNDRSVKGCALLPLQCHIEISEGGCNLEIAKDPDRQNIDMLLRYAESLHVHDHSSITTASLDCIKGQFEKTQWCLVERCPKMHTVFHIDKDGNTPQSFMSLQTFKAFQLLEVQCIWSRKVRFYEDSTNRLLAFKKLQCINLYSCPRLKFILPWSFASLPGLETILVTYCGELREIFPKGETHGRDRATSIVFSSLKRIQLEELPRLRQICETVMLAPALETVKLRGCWSLRRLPAIHTGRGNNKPLAVVDCEKDWWDMLRWDGLEESRTLFVPRHSKYHKMRMLRGSPLRFGP